MVSSTVGAQNTAPTLSRTIALSSILRARHAPGKINMPLQGGAGFMRLRHVQGIPSIRSDYGFSPARLRMLDAMVDQMKSRGSDRYSAGRFPEPGSLFSIYA